MSKTPTRSARIRQASALPKGSKERKAILASLTREASAMGRIEEMVGDALDDLAELQKDFKRKNYPAVSNFLQHGRLDALDAKLRLIRKFAPKAEQEFASGQHD